MPTLERSEIRFGTTRIPFRIRRSARRATVALTIDAGRLVVTAPARATVDRLNEVVRHKARWVVQHIDKNADAAANSSEREFVTGETVLYLGRQYRLKLIDGDDESAFRGGWYEVAIPAKRGDATRRQQVRLRLRLARSLRARAELYLSERLDDVCERLRIHRPALIVRDQRKRWGSYDANGTIRINWRIVQAPAALIDYVLIHELAHQQHRAHGREFWRAVEQWLPDYEERRRRLRALGPTLEW